jgi:hypothetical protein
VNGQNVIPEILKEKMKSFSSFISERKKGYTGKQFYRYCYRNWGSDLGPAMVVEVWQYYSNHLQVHFVSNVWRPCKISNKIRSRDDAFCHCFLTTKKLKQQRLKKWF